MSEVDEPESRLWFVVILATIAAVGLLVGVTVFSRAR